MDGLECYFIDIEEEEFLYYWRPYTKDSIEIGSTEILHIMLKVSQQSLSP